MKLKVLIAIFVVYIIYMPIRAYADDFCKKYPRLDPCVCETTKNELGNAITVFFSFLQIVEKIKINPLSTDMAKLQYIISESGRLASKGFKNSLRYKCYKQTSSCEKAIEKLSIDITHLSKASKLAGGLRKAILEYKVVYDEIKVQSKTSHYFWRQRNKAVAQQRIRALSDISKAKKYNIINLINDIEMRTFKARHLSKHKKKFIDNCVKIYEKRWEDIINNEGLEKIEI